MFPSIRQARVWAAKQQSTPERNRYDIPLLDLHPARLFSGAQEVAGLRLEFHPLQHRLPVSAHARGHPRGNPVLGAGSRPCRFHLPQGTHGRSSRPHRHQNGREIEVSTAEIITELLKPNIKARKDNNENKTFADVHSVSGGGSIDVRLCG